MLHFDAEKRIHLFQNELIWPETQDQPSGITFKDYFIDGKIFHIGGEVLRADFLDGENVYRFTQPALLK